MTQGLGIAADINPTNCAPSYGHSCLPAALRKTGAAANALLETSVRAVSLTAAWRADGHVALRNLLSADPRQRRWSLAVHRPLRWGIAGTGLIAEDMTSVASMLPGVVLQAVAARKSVDKAKAFVEKHGARGFVPGMLRVVTEPCKSRLLPDCKHAMRPACNSFSNSTYDGML